MIKWGHNFAHATTAELSWCVHHCNRTRLIGLIISIKIHRKTWCKIWVLSSQPVCKMGPGARPDIEYSQGEEVMNSGCQARAVMRSRVCFDGDYPVLTGVKLTPLDMPHEQKITDILTNMICDNMHVRCLKILLNSAKELFIEHLFYFCAAQIGIFRKSNLFTSRCLSIERFFAHLQLQMIQPFL